jgi:hypothetical protein
MNPMLMQQRPSAGSTLSIRFAALVFAGMVVLSATGTAAAGDVAQVANHKKGVAASDTINGMPVYRLPTITVTASRSVELARNGREKSAGSAEAGKVQANELHVAHSFVESGVVAHLAGSPR